MARTTPALGGRRNPESVDQGMEQAHVAELHARARAPPNCFEAVERQGRGSRRPRPRRPGGRWIRGPPGGTRRSRPCACGRPGRHRNSRRAAAPWRSRCWRQTGIVYSGLQAQLRAGRILRHEHAPPDILAREVDEHVRRLQHRRLDPRIALALEQRDQRNNGIRLRHWPCPTLVSACSLAMPGREGDCFWREG